MERALKVLGHFILNTNAKNNKLSSIKNGLTYLQET